MERGTFYRRVAYLICIAMLLLPLSYLAQPSAAGKPGASGGGGLLARMRSDYHLSQTNLGELDPASETIKLASLGMHGVAANILWLKSNEYKMKQNWTALSATLEQITKLQPNFIAVWRHQAWNLAYNVSVEFDDYRDRYDWVKRGIKFLRDGIDYNLREPRLWWDHGWFIGYKIGRSDEHKQFRKLFLADDDYHGDRPIEERDNWLVGRESFLEAQRLVDDEGVILRGMNPVLFHINPTMWLLNYAAQQEEEGQFADAIKHWQRAQADLLRYEARELPGPDSKPLRLRDYAPVLERQQKLLDELEALDPGLQERMRQEKIAGLSADERAAYLKPDEERNDQEHRLAADAAGKVFVTHEEVGRRIDPDKRSASGLNPEELATQISELRIQASILDSYRTQVNLDYWLTRCEAESDPLAVEARKAIFEGNEAYDRLELALARQKFEEGIAGWRKVLDKYPSTVTDAITGSELMEMIKRYRAILRQDGITELPDDFLLNDIVAEHEPRDPTPRESEIPKQPKE